MLGGCIPHGATLPAALPLPVVPIVATPPRLEVDLSQLKDDRAIWEMQPVEARAVTANGKRFHIVATGQTGIAIARAYGLAWNRIVDANALTEPFVLRVGQRLLLPAAPAGGTAEMTLEGRAAAFQIGIDDLVTGSAPAQVAATPPAASPSIITAPTVFVWPLQARLPVASGRRGAARAIRVST